jgi:hypothetical protein
MSDSLGDARRALRSGEAGEALVHLWNALEQARGEGDTRVLGRIAELAGRAAEQGDEGERAEAERLLAELHGEVEEAAGTEDDEDWASPHGEPAAPPDPGPPPEITAPGTEPAGDAEVEEEEPPQSRRRAALGWLIPIAIFLFFTFRDAFS